ncbi:6-bladed beta-propeller, partial [Candidatus Sumerlaeota bacterium]|nr:6-bladed beta-propeller [Candidatus Sumerlaeota bacterium]
DFLAGPEDRSFAVPYDVHLTADDVLLVTDPGKACAHFIDMRQHVYSEVRQMGRQALEQPIGVTADENGEVYVSDSALGNVFVFNIRGEFLRSLTQPGRISRPADLCYHARTGLLYVADVTAHDVKVFRCDGTLVRTVGGRGMERGKLNYPTHVWIEDSGTLFVTSAMDGAINVFGPSGEFLSSFGQFGDTPGFFSRPKGVATDRAGHIHVADAIFDNVQIFDRRGSLLLPYGQAGSGAGELWLPAGIFIDSRDRIFVADQHNHRVAVFQYLEVGAQ